MEGEAFLPPAWFAQCTSIRNHDSRAPSAKRTNATRSYPAARATSLKYWLRVQLMYKLLTDFYTRME
eukprot:1262012-Amphidinium_carterae.1